MVTYGYRQPLKTTYFLLPRWTKLLQALHWVIPSLHLISLGNRLFYPTFELFCCSEFSTQNLSFKLKDPMNPKMALPVVKFLLTGSLL